jgi:hypothetical protein
MVSLALSALAAAAVVIIALLAVAGVVAALVVVTVVHIITVVGLAAVVVALVVIAVVVIRGCYDHATVAPNATTVGSGIHDVSGVVDRLLAIAVVANGYADPWAGVRIWDDIEANLGTSRC